MQPFHLEGIATKIRKSMADGCSPELEEDHQDLVKSFLARGQEWDQNKKEEKKKAKEARQRREKEKGKQKKKKKKKKRNKKKKRTKEQERKRKQEYRARKKLKEKALKEAGGGREICSGFVF